MTRYKKIILKMSLSIIYNLVIGGAVVLVNSIFLLTGARDMIIIIALVLGSIGFIGGGLLPLIFGGEK